MDRKGYSDEDILKLLREIAEAHGLARECVAKNYKGGLLNVSD